MLKKAKQTNTRPHVISLILNYLLWEMDLVELAS